MPEPRPRPRWLWVGYLDPAADPHRVGFLAGLAATLGERGLALDARRLNRSGPDTAGEAPVTRLPGAGRHPADAWFRLRRGGGRADTAGAAAFAATRGLGPRAARRRAAAVAAALGDALDGEPVVGLLLWNQFADVSRVAAGVARRRGLPVRFVHEGVLPGSVAIEEGGQMADSPLARAAADPPPTTDAGLAATRAYLAAAAAGRVSRKPPPRGGAAGAVERALAGVRGPVLFYAGQNDEAAGLVPRSHPRAAFHSPHFTGTLDALTGLQDAARAGGFTVLFKPHPLWRERHGDAGVRRALDPAASRFAPEAGVFDAIDRCDATATVVSQAAYLARMRGKPALLMGRMPMTGWGCCVELGSRGALPDAAAEALAGGPAGADAAFLRHATAARERFLLPYDPAVAEHFPRTLGDAADELAAASRR